MNKAKNSAILGIFVTLAISLLEVFLLVNIQVYIAKLFIKNDARVLENFLRYCELYTYLLPVDNVLNSLLAVLKSL